MVNKTDTLYASALDEVTAFQFDSEVAHVFNDMIRRSVPGYETLIIAISLLAGRYAQKNSRCYDLGCALGAVARAMRQTICEPDCDIIAVDNSSAMIESAKELAAHLPKKSALHFKCANIEDIVITDASVVVMNLTLQFIPISKRLPLIVNIYQGLKPGGAFILAEKISFSEEDKQAFHTDSHHLFKRAHGYSDLEISQKRQALDNILIADTAACHQQRLAQAGFSFIDKWFQCFNFVAYIAIK